MTKAMLRPLALVALFCAAASAQKGSAENGYYPMGYGGDTWAGEVTAVDNDRRELTLTYAKGKKVETFTVVIPDGGFGWNKDAGGDRILVFSTAAADGKAKAGAAAQERPDLSEFMGRRLKVYYVRKERPAGGAKEKINEVFQLKVLKSEKRKDDGKQP